MRIFAKQNGETLKTIFMVMSVRFSFKSSGYVFAIDRVIHAQMSEKSSRSLTFSMFVFIARSDRLFE